MCSEDKDHIGEGEKYFNEGDFNRAIEEFNNAIKLNSGSEVKLRNYIAIAYAKKGFLEKSIEEFKVVLKLEPSYLTAKTNLAIAVCEQSQKYIEDGKLDSAIHILKEVSDIIPENPLPISSLGIIYALKDKKSEGMEFLQKAISLCNSAEYEPLKKSVEEEIKNLENGS